MNTRRQFLAAIPAAAVAAVPPAVDAAPPDDPGLRRVYRKAGDGWERVRMYELAPGHLFRFDLDPDDVLDWQVRDREWRVTAPPDRDADGTWRVCAEEILTSRSRSA